MNSTNNTSTIVFNYEEPTTAIAILSSIGAFIFLENFVLLCIVANVLKRLDSKNGQRDIIIQSIFVSVIDGLSGLLFFLSLNIRVTDDISAYACCYVSYISGIMTLISQVNLAFISAYRFKTARNLRKLRAKRKSYFTAILTFINGSVFVSQTITFAATIKIRPIPDWFDFPCNFNMVAAEVQTLFGAVFSFIIGSTCLLTADVLCLVTIFLLKREIRVTVSSLEPVSTLTTDSSQTVFRQTARRQQQTAIFVLFVILVIFNLSTMPIVVVAAMRFMGVSVSYMFEGWAILALYLHALLNPIVICTRILEIRKTVKNLFILPYRRLKTVFS